MSPEARWVLVSLITALHCSRVNRSSDGGRLAHRAVLSTLRVCAMYSPPHSLGRYQERTRLGHWGGWGRPRPRFNPEKEVELNWGPPRTLAPTASPPQGAFALP